MINKGAKSIKANFKNGTYFDPYIDSGLQNKMYTLRASYKTWNFTGEIVADIHLTNLSTDATKAETKAYQLTGKQLTTDLTVNDISRNDTDANILEFGKYKGHAVADVAKSNPDYLVFIVENDYIPTKYQANRAAIITAMGERLNVSDTGITLNFGKYEGQTLTHIAQIDPDYIADLIESGEASLPIPARRIFVDMIRAVDDTLAARRKERDSLAV